MGNHFSCWLVVRNHAGRRWVDTHMYRFAIDFDAVAELHALADVGRFVVNRYSPLQDKLLHLKSRTQTGLRQNFVQLGRVGLWSEHALSNANIWINFISVKLSADDSVKGSQCNRFEYPMDFKRIGCSHKAKFIE